MEIFSELFWELLYAVNVLFRLELTGSELIFYGTLFVGWVLSGPILRIIVLKRRSYARAIGKLFYCDTGFKKFYLSQADKIARSAPFLGVPFGNGLRKYYLQQVDEAPTTTHPVGLIWGTEDQVANDNKMLEHYITKIYNMTDPMVISCLYFVGGCLFWVACIFLL